MTICVDISPHRPIPYREGFISMAYKYYFGTIPFSCTSQHQTLLHFKQTEVPWEKESTRPPQVPTWSPRAGNY